MIFFANGEELRPHNVFHFFPCLNFRELERDVHLRARCYGQSTIRLLPPRLIREMKGMSAGKEAHGDVSGGIEQSKK